MNNILIKDILFGKTDASNELQEVGNQYFLKSFLPYEKYKISEFLNGARYYIIGRKGTGKTALLKYLECRFAENEENLVIPIRFKSDFDSLDKKKIRTAAINVQDEIVDNDNGDNSVKSYVIAWKVYLIYLIFKNQESLRNEFVVFDPYTDQYKTLWTLLKVLYGENDSNKIVPKITKGTVEISADLEKKISASVKLEIELREKEKTVNYELICKKIIQLYKELIGGINSAYILIDELELSIATKKQRIADIELIRDLILAIDALNKISKSQGYNVKIYASIRSDVLDSALSSGYEINKCIEDFGVTIEWFQKGGNYTDNPLLKIVETKIHASEIAQNVPESEDVWKKYFDDRINNIEVRKYILNYSWYRPRDIIRMLLLVQDQCQYGETKINQEKFDRALREYSNLMWNELKEEMALKYSPDDIRAIKRILNGINVPFTFMSLNTRIDTYASMYDYVDAFRKKTKIPEFLEQLFEWGLIGNSGERMVFKFLGYKEIDISKPMIIHTPLRNFFEVV
ncbi:uncharacterized protein BN789_00314 [Clostridium sp. CAG:81]|nr:uncharacterized protein BN789_00314 [Clostridium sp. CAG:81]